MHTSLGPSAGKHLPYMLHARPAPQRYMPARQAGEVGHGYTSITGLTDSPAAAAHALDPGELRRAELDEDASQHLVLQ